MPEKKRPRRTRERILETSLALFNRRGAPHVTTADLAGEMNISPGNLYYHFRNRDEIVGELYAAFEARLKPLLADPRDRDIGVEDFWLWLHLLFELMGEYRFLYRDQDELAARDPTLAMRFGRLLRQGTATVVELCRAMVGAGTMNASEREIAALAGNVVLVATYCARKRRRDRRRSRRVPGARADRPLSRRRRARAHRPARARLPLKEKIPWRRSGPNFRMRTRRTSTTRRG
jgi:AcrR family transcriptional regulator